MRKENIDKKSIVFTVFHSQRSKGLRLSIEALPTRYAVIWASPLWASKVGYTPKDKQCHGENDHKPRGILRVLYVFDHDFLER